MPCFCPPFGLSISPPVAFVGHCSLSLTLSPLSLSFWMPSRTESVFISRDSLDLASLLSLFLPSSSGSSYFASLTACYYFSGQFLCSFLLFLFFFLVDCSFSLFTNSAFAAQFNLSVSFYICVQETRPIEHISHVCVNCDCASP